MIVCMMMSVFLSFCFLPWDRQDYTASSASSSTHSILHTCNEKLSPTCILFLLVISLSLMSMIVCCQMIRVMRARPVEELLLAHFQRLRKRVRHVQRAMGELFDPDEDRRRRRGKDSRRRWLKRQAERKYESIRR